MADSAAFDHVCRELESLSILDRLEARGTVRLTLKEAGLDPASVTPEQLDVVLDKVMPQALASRGVDDAASLCERLRGSLKDVETSAVADSPEAVFARLGGSN
jgi:hypothetical protein